MASSVEETINNSSSSSRSSSTVITSTMTTKTTTTTTKRRQLPMPPTIMLSSCDLSPSSAPSVPIPMPIDDTTTDVNNNRVDHKKLSLERPSSGFNPSNRRHSNTSRRLSNSAIGALDYLDLSQLGQALANSAADDSCSSAKSLIVTDEENPSGEKLNQTKVSLTNSLTDVNEDLINEKNNEIGRVTKWATGFEKLLEDPLGLQIFTEFLKKEFSEENIDFWVKCENYKKLATPEEMRKGADDIWNNYLDTSAMHQINVDNKARSHCKEALQNPNNTMFEMAQNQIFMLMKYDSYSRFLKSQMYKECIVNEMEGKPIISAVAAGKKPSGVGMGGRPQSGSKAGAAANSQTNVNDEAATTNVMIGGGGPGANSSITNLSATTTTTTSQQTGAQSSQQSPSLVASSSASNLFQQLNPSTGIPPAPPLPQLGPTGLLQGASNNATSSLLNLVASSASSSSTSTLNNSAASSSAALAAAAAAAANSDTLNRKEKKRSTIIPWTKAFIKWKRLSGKQDKEKKAAAQNEIPNQASQAANSNPNKLRQQQFSAESNFPPTNAMNQSNSQFNDSINSQFNLMDSSNLMNTSTALSNQFDGKFCRVLCNNDGSSTMIQAIPGRTVFQALSKIFMKKNVPWYKCDLYFVEDYQPVDQQMDAQVLGSKEICLIERSLFVLSLIPIAINLCVKANLKKPISTIIQPILDFYQIKLEKCTIYLNSANMILNLNDLCSTIDGQHVLIAHKNQTNLLSPSEIEKFISVSISDFIPSNLLEFQLQFDELGILKQIKKQAALLNSPTNSNNTFNATAIEHQQQQQQQQMQQQQTTSQPTSQSRTNTPSPRLFLKSVNEEPGEKSIIEMLNKAQNLSLEDQRGPLQGSKLPLEIPEFLLHHHQYSHHHHHHHHQQHNYERAKTYNYQNYRHEHFQIRVPHVTAAAYNSHLASGTSQMSSETTMPRSRSPIVIVYDNEECIDNDNDEAAKRTPSKTVVRNYESISELNSPYSPPPQQQSSSSSSNQQQQHFQSHHNSSSHDLANKSQISYV